ncbi:hypothetical protein FOVG_08224 [Fusarium oxysporum f. sp. pisi HDV247]|uniref:Uncharacterized protein n=1 Tax=Fusarium oxysporum f. sp. pisi HDV247 TaxID=1080344 RepID=W9PLT2_FUSOX|nr:hypothetical protein FOVG_08224 [Fusarium oxysporum f. sp. pisi HDV247]
MKARRWQLTEYYWPPCDGLPKLTRHKKALSMFPSPWPNESKLGIKMRTKSPKNQKTIGISNSTPTHQIQYVSDARCGVHIQGQLICITFVINAICYPSIGPAV